MKKPVRLLLLGTGLFVAGIVGLGLLALQSGVQTWAARRALADQPALKARVGQVSAGFETVALHDLHFEQDGAVIALPSFLAEMSVIDAGLNQKVNLRRLVAHGWTLDLTACKFSEAASPRSGAAAAAAAPAAAVAQIFHGIFAQAALPFDLTLEALDLEGVVKLPPAPGIASGLAHVVIKGGGIGAGREGAFTFNITIALTGTAVPVSSLSVTGRFAAAMDTPRTFSRLATQAEASAQGPQFPQGVKLAADVAATRVAGGENYAITLSDGVRLLAALKADLSAANRHLVGTWKLDLRDTELTPFTLGRTLPSFSLIGDGGLDVDVATTEVRATGKLNAAGDKLGAIRPELAVVGAVQIVAEFDLARRGDSLRVERLSAAIAGAEPVARVESLQPFEFNARSGELKVADPARELLGLTLQGLPLTWAQPVLGKITVSGGPVRGEFVAIASNGGFSLRPKQPLTVAGVSLAQPGKPLLRSVDFSLHASADYTPQGWQAELTPLVAKDGAATLLTLEVKAGQLLGKDQPIKAAGKFSTDLVAALAQPFGGGALVLTSGNAAGDFVVSLGAKQEIQAKLALSNLAGDPKLTPEKLPTLSADVRAEIAANGAATLNVPLFIEREGRKSDLTLAGTLTRGKAGLVLDANLTSTNFVVADAQVLAGVVPASAGGAASPETAPPWAGVSGRVVLALKKVVYSDAMLASDITGTVTLEAGAAKLVNFRAGLGEGADAKVNGGVTFNPKSATPYALAADLAVNEFDPAPLFRALNPGQPVTVEGKFSVSSELGGHAAHLGDFAAAATGNFHFSSRGGIFRGLPVRFAAKVESAGKIAAGAAAIGNLIGSVTGKKDSTDLANKAQAVAEFSKTLGAIHYDQLSVVLSRDAALNTELKDFTLITPELRLVGGGQALHRAGSGLLEQPVALEFALRARGRTAELMKYLGALEPQADELGYARCTLPLKVSGSLGQPDTTELNQRLATLALEKSGVSEKASELFNKLLGGGK
jgi:hypothetical protein